MFLLQNTCRKRAGNFAPSLPSTSVSLGASTQMLLGNPAGTAATTTSFHSPSISASWKPASNFSESLEFWRGFCFEKESDVISFTRKGSVIKRHLNCSGCLQQPGMCQVCQATASTERDTGFVFGFAQTGAFGECFNHWIRLLSWHTALSSSAYVNLPAAAEVFVQGSQGSGWISPLSHSSVISPGKIVHIASILERHLERRCEGHQICC